MPEPQADAPPQPSRGRDAALVFGVALVAGVALSRVWTLPLQVDWVLADAGQILNPSMWLLDGRMPYRDFGYFWGPYGPLLHAGAFAAFGLHESVMRACAATAVAAATAGTYAFARSTLRRGAALLAALLCWALLSRFTNLGYANVYCVPLGVWAMVAAWGAPTRRRAVVAGALAGAALAFKINAGGAIAVTAWLVLLRPRPGLEPPARARWADPLWPPLLGYPVLVALLTRQGPTAAMRYGFLLACAVAIVPFGRAAALRARLVTDATALRRRWTLGAWFVAGIVLAQAPWLAYYLPRMAPAQIWDGLVAAPLSGGLGLAAMSPRGPHLLTWLLLGAFVVAGLPAARRAVPVLGGLALVGAGGWYAVDALRVIPPVAEIAMRWVNLLAVLPVVAVVGGAAVSWPRRLEERGAESWLRAVALAAGVQVIVAFPWGEVGHVAYVAPYSALAVAWAVAHGWQARADRSPGGRTGVALRAVVPVLLLLIVVERRAEVWLAARRVTGEWPRAVRVAPPRADVWAPAPFAEPVRRVRDVLADHPAVAADRLLSYPVPYFYWLTGTHNPMYHDHLWPGQLDAAGDAAEAARLARARPLLVVLRWGAPVSAFDLEVLRRYYPAITGYIDREYVPWQRIRPYRLLVPRTDVPPGT